jgi:hypothetical protein
VCRPADCRIVHAQIASDGTHDDLAGVEPDADLHVNAESIARVRGVVLDLLLHTQRRIAGSYRMILVGNRSAEDRHDPVAHHEADGAFVTMDGLHHAFEHRVEELPRLLGVTVG